MMITAHLIFLAYFLVATGVIFAGYLPLIAKDKHKAARLLSAILMTALWPIWMPLAMSLGMMRAAESE